MPFDKLAAVTQASLLTYAAAVACVDEPDV